MENSEKIKIEYEKNESNEIHYEEMKYFRKSLYKNIYTEAFSQVETILNCNASGNDGLKSGSRYRETRQINNIISFIGERGTGKTSSMLSFMEALKDYYYIDGREEDIFYKLKINGRPSKVSFVGIEHIDASLLENGEDIFEVILSMMYSKLKNLERNNFLENDVLTYSKKDVFRRFERVYEAINNLKGRKSKEYIPNEFESYMSSMDSLSVSMELRDQFEKLVKEYLNIIRFRKKAVRPADDWEICTEPYLVITIDDVDMNIESGYEMLEQIHRYLMVKHVIVLLAVDDFQMSKICKRHYWEIYSKSMRKNNMRDWEKYIHRLASEYMDKVLPISRRIYMPQIQEMKDSMTLVLKKEGEKTTMEENAKEHILRQIAQKSLVCFDAMGLKQHFYEPVTIRGCVSLCQFLLQMENLGSDSDNFRDVYEKNYTQLSADIFKRMVNEKLMDEERETFNLIRECTVARKGKFALDILVNRLEEICLNSGCSKGRCSKKTGYVIGKINNSAYSYGNLLWVIFLLGNCKNKELKPLIKCLLAYLSLVYTRQYVLNFSSEGKENIDLKENLKFYLGDSVIGGWVNEMFPQIKDGEKTGDNTRWYLLGKATDVDMNRIIEAWEIPQEWLELNTKDSFAENKERLSFSWIRDLEWFFMLFSDFYDQEKNRTKLSMRYTGENTVSNKLSGDENSTEKNAVFEIEGKADFNLLGFVKNMFLWEEYFKNIDETILCILMKHFSQKMNLSAEDKTDLRNQLQTSIREKSIAQEFSDWQKQYHGFAIPFYNIDMTYNVLKRVKRTYQEKGVQVIQCGEIMEEIQEFYNRITERLAEEAEIYNKCENTLIADVSKAFETCPFIEIFKNKCEDISEKEKWQNIFFQIAKANKDNDIIYSGEIFSLSDVGGK